MKNLIKSQWMAMDSDGFLGYVLGFDADDALKEARFQFGSIPSLDVMFERAPLVEFDDSADYDGFDA